MDGGVRSLCRPHHRVGIGHVARDHLDPERREWRCVRRLPGERPDVVTALGELLADVGAGEAGGAGHEDRLTHADSCRMDSSGLAASTWSGL